MNNIICSIKKNILVSQIILGLCQVNIVPLIVFPRVVFGSPQKLHHPDLVFFGFAISRLSDHF